MVSLKGQCMCGTVQYAYEGEVGNVLNCHCTECRQWHGAAFRTRTTGRLDAFCWLKGEDLVKRFEGDENPIKTFCEICGSNLVSLYKKDTSLVGLPIAAMEGAVSLKPVAHVFVSEKAPWYEITDDLPQYPRFPDDMDVHLKAK